VRARDQDRVLCQRVDARLTGLRLINAVQLIKALGGGWTEQHLLAKAQR